MIEQILKKYLEAIDIEQNKDIKAGKVLEVKIHQGYYATVQRYIENSERITIAELYRILSLYSIDDLPPIDVVVDDYISIAIVPQPVITLKGVEVQHQITYVPQPVTVFVRGIQIGMVPQPSIILIMPLSLSYVPQPVINMEGIINILQVPQAVIDLQNLPNPIPTITDVPQPVVLVVEERGIAIMSIPQPSVDIITSIPTGMYFYGFTPYNNINSRDVNVSYMKTVDIVDTMLYTTDYKNEGFLQVQNIEARKSDSLPCPNWHLNIPVGESSYMVFLIPETLAQRTSWQSDLGNGAIGGPLNEGVAGNHWPDPDATVQYKGIDYYLYVGNRRRRLSGTITLNS